MIEKENRDDCFMQAVAALNMWTNEFANKASQAAMIEAMCNSGYRSQSEDVFSSSLVEHVCPHKRLCLSALVGRVVLLRGIKRYLFYIHIIHSLVFLDVHCFQLTCNYVNGCYYLAFYLFSMQFYKSMGMAYIGRAYE